MKARWTISWVGTTGIEAPPAGWRYLTVSSWIGTGRRIVERRGASKLENSPGVSFVDDQDIDHTGAKCAEDRERFLDFAGHRDNGVDTEEILDR